MYATEIAQHPFILSSSTAQQICKPLFETIGVNLFAHAVVFPDNSYTGSITNAEWARTHFFAKGWHKHADIACGFNNLSSYKGVSSQLNSGWNLPSYFRQDAIYSLRQNDHYHHLYIAEKTNNLFESFWFAVGADKGCDVLLQHQKELQYFIMYYQEQTKNCQKLQNIYEIKLNDYNHKNMDPNFSCIPDTTNTTAEFLVSCQVQKFYLAGGGNKNWLTKQQVKCLKHIMIESKSAKATARSLNISYRTVQKHMNNVRRKFGSQLDVVASRLIEIQDFL